MSSVCYKKSTGFTLIELLIVIGIIIVLAGVVIVAVNPMRQFAMANNSRRMADVSTILNAVSQNIVDNKGTWACAAGSLPTSPTNMADPVSDPDGYDICNCLAPTYVPELSVDPTTSTYVDCTDYNSGYSISQDAVTSRVTISAPNAQSEGGSTPVISVTR